MLEEVRLAGWQTVEAGMAGLSLCLCLQLSGDLLPSVHTVMLRDRPRPTAAGLPETIHNMSTWAGRDADVSCYKLTCKRKKALHATVMFIFWISQIQKLPDIRMLILSATDSISDAPNIHVLEMSLCTQYLVGNVQYNLIIYLQSCPTTLD